MAIDWATVGTTLAEIRPKVRESLDFATETAAAANEAIGTEIAEYLATQVPIALEILEKVLKEIEAKTLNVESAKGYLEKLKEHMTKTREHLKPTVAKLPEAVAATIRTRMDENTAFTSGIAKKIIELLQ